MRKSLTVKGWRRSFSFLLCFACGDDHKSLNMPKLAFISFQSVSTEFFMLTRT